MDVAGGHEYHRLEDPIGDDAPDDAPPSKNQIEAASMAKAPRYVSKTGNDNWLYLFYANVYFACVAFSIILPSLWPYLHNDLFAQPVKISQNTFVDRTRCTAQLRPGSSFLRSAL